MPFVSRRSAPFAILAALIFSGCSLTLPVRGSLSATGEAFNGTATGRVDGSGNLKLVSSKGTKCSGNFVYVTRRQGEGVLSCDDGRTGPFRFASTGRRGTGQGELNGESFTFTFGKD